MVLKTATKDALAVSIQCGRNRVAGIGLNLPLMEPEFQARFSPGKNDSRTSLDTVFRTAFSHCRQPER